jgi:peptidoglycan L-alanyl-D-glutamate endopeptidase CwlK
MAIDAGPYFKELRNTDWDDHLAFSLFAGHVLAVAKFLFASGEITHQLIWGGDWNSNGRNADQHFNDLNHFELTEKNVWSL